MKRFGIIIAAVLIVGSTVFSSAQITNADNSKRPDGGAAIVLTLSVQPLQVKVGESLQLGICLKNITDGKIFVGQEVAESDDSDYDVFAVNDEGKEAPTTPYYRFIKGKRLPGDPKFRSTFSRNIIPLDPGSSLNSKIDLDHVRRLDIAGTYKIWVERFDGISNSRVKSNVVTITVTP